MFVKSNIVCFIDKFLIILDNRVMNLKFSKIIDRLEDLFFKNHACICCRREIPDGTEFSLCKNCFDKLDVIDGTTCKTCGEKILEGNIFCDRCKLIKYNFDKSNSFAVYDDTASRIVKRFKYNGKKYYAEHIAKLMAKNEKYFEDIDFITFVPVSDKRKKERGFNQAEEIARELGKIYEIKVLNTLEKLGNGKHQAGLTKKERRENLSGSFALKEDVKEIIKGKNILIIDDVFTTGSTLSECAKALKSARTKKPAKIYCYTFAKTKLEFTNNGQNQQNNWN